MALIVMPALSWGGALCPPEAVVSPNYPSVGAMKDERGPLT